MGCGASRPAQPPPALEGPGAASASGGVPAGRRSLSEGGPIGHAHGHARVHASGSKYLPASRRSASSYAVSGAPLSLCDWSSLDVQAWMRSLGAAYAPYALVVGESSLDGSYLARLLSLSPEAADAKLASHIGVASALHREVLLERLARVAAASADEGVEAHPHHRSQALSLSTTEPGVMDHSFSPTSPSQAHRRQTTSGAYAWHVQLAEQQQQQQQAAAAHAAAASKAHSSQLMAVDAHVQEATQHVKQVKAATAQMAAQGAQLLAQGEAAAAIAARTEAKVDAWMSGAAPGILSARISNLPKLCAFTARDGVMAQVRAAYAAASAADVRCPVIALTGIAGSGKSELAKQYAWQDFERPDAEAAAVAPASGGSAEHTPAPRLCWFLNSENADTLLRDYRLLCSALHVEWRSQDGELPSATFARMQHEVQDKMRRYDALLLFDNAVTYDSIEAYLPHEAGSRARILVTSLNDSLLISDPARGQCAISLNGGLSVSEALALLAATSAVPTPAAPARRATGVPQQVSEYGEQVALIDALDRLPLAISTAGLYIRAMRIPKKGRGSGSASLHYGAKQYVEDLRNHSIKLQRSGGVLRGQSDYKLGQASALQMAITRTPPHFRRLLDYCTLLDSQALQYPLLVSLYSRMRLQDDHGPSVPVSPGSSSPGPLQCGDDTAEDAFDAMLSSPSNYSLLAVDATSNRLYMHRSTQLQLTLMAEAHYGASGASSPHAGGSSSARDVPVDLSKLNSTPTPLQHWKAGLLSDIVASLHACWPAREEDTTSVLSLEPIVPALARLVDECRSMPMLHESLATTHAHLMSLVHLAVLCLHWRDEYTEMGQLAAAAGHICAPDSEIAQWFRMWACLARWQLDADATAQQQLQALLDELQQSHPHDRLILRGRVCAARAQAQQVSNPAASLRMSEASLAAYQEHFGRSEHSRIARAWSNCARAHQRLGALQRSLECDRTALSMMSRVCGSGSAEPADMRRAVAMHPLTPPAERVSHLREVMRVYDQVYGCTSKDAVACAVQLATALHKSGDAAAAFAWLDERQRVMAQLGDSERAASFLDAHGQLLASDPTRSDQASACFQSSYNMSERVHGSEHAATLERLARLALSKYSQWRVRDASAPLRTQLLAAIPAVCGRIAVVLLALGRCCEHFAAMRDWDGELCIRQRACQLASDASSGGCPDFLLAAHQSYELGWWYHRRSRWQDAMSHYRHALACFDTHGQLSMATRTASRLGAAMDEAGDAEGGMQAQQKALQLAIKASGARSKLVAEQHGAMAHMLQRRGQYALALQHLLLSLHMRQQIGAAATTSADVHVTSLLKQMSAAAAPVALPLSDLQSILVAVADASPDPSLDALRVAHVNLAAAMLSARVDLSHAHALLAHASELAHPSGRCPSAVHFWLAELHAQRADLQAELLARIAEEEALTRECGPDHIDTGYAHLRLARSYAQLRQYAAAVPHYRAVDRAFALYYGSTHERCRRAVAISQWCTQQVESSPPPHQSCLIRWEGDRIARHDRIPFVHSSVLCGADEHACAAGSGVPQPLRPLSSMPAHVRFYEVTLDGPFPHVSVGFASPTHHHVSLLPGDSKHSVAVRCRDGSPCTLEQLSARRDYGPAVCEGDVLGALLDTAAGTVRFLLNGVPLAPVPCDTEAMSYACVGFDDAAACGAVRVNLGSQPFRFPPTTEIGPQA